MRVRVNELQWKKGAKRKSKREGERMDRTQTDWQLVRGGGCTGVYLIMTDF